MEDQKQPKAEKKPVKRSLRDRIINPLANIRAAKPDQRRSRVLFLWSKGAHAGQLGDMTPEMLDDAPPEDILKLAVILLEAGHMTQATALAAQAYEATPGLLTSYRYPALTLALSQMRPDLVAHLVPELEALEAFSKQGDLFGDMVRASAGSIAVVGNSPALLEQENGAEIDDHDIVIRFNNYQLAPKWIKSTGRKTTIWVHRNGYAWLWRRDREFFDLSILPGRAGFYRTLNGQDLILDHSLRGQKCDFIPHSIYHRLLCDHAIGAPSMGLLCLNWLHQILEGLEQTSLYGFRMLDQSKFQTLQYFDQGHRIAKNRHNWRAEYAALSYLAPEHFPPMHEDYVELEGDGS